MERFFDEFPSFSSAPTAEFRKDVDFIPPCDLEETEGQYLISVDAPGMTKDQLQVELSGNTLIISGDKRSEKKEEKGERRYYERYQGHFERAFTLPDAAEAEKVEAEYRDGVLRIAIPKAAAAKTRKIQIGEGKGGQFARISKGEEKQKQSERAA
jgi:HSP20 family protein